MKFFEKLTTLGNIFAVEFQKCKSRNKMIVKLVLRIGVLAIELFLAFYSMIISDSLLVKFLFFAFSAIIVAFAVTKITNKLLPEDKDYISTEQENG